MNRERAQRLDRARVTTCRSHASDNGAGVPGELGEEELPSEGAGCARADARSGFASARSTFDVRWGIDQDCRRARRFRLALRLQEAAPNTGP